MKKITKQLSALAFAAVFAATMQGSYGLDTPVNTNLGVNNGGAIINDVTGGYVDCVPGENSATLNFNGNAIVDWQSLNLDPNETLNFNAQTGYTNLTVLNRVNSGMSKIYGDINANSGIGKLIISNPNGMLFDGGKFTSTAGELFLTTQSMAGANLDSLDTAAFTQVTDGTSLIPIDMRNYTFDVFGDFTIVAPYVSGDTSIINANTFKITTVDGSVYESLGAASPVNNRGVTFLKSMQIDGDVVITNPEGAMAIYGGGEINGDLTVDTKGNTFINFYQVDAEGNLISSLDNDSAERLTLNGNLDVTSQGQWAYAKNIDVNGNSATNNKGNVTMSNSGGALELNNSNVTGNVNMTTTGWGRFNGGTYNHYIHVSGNTSVGGDMTLNASENIHIGGYTYSDNKILDGNLNVVGDLYAHSDKGHITTTINTTAKNITFIADDLNILSDGVAVLTADTYDFQSTGYIGGLKCATNDDSGRTNPKLVDVMENYRFIPDNADTYTDNLIIGGGEIKNLEIANDEGEAYIESKDDVLVTGVLAHELNIVAPDKYIHIKGPDVYADDINVGGRTDKVEVDFPGERHFTLNYTNIHDGVVTTVPGDQVITYELTNEPTNGYNAGTQISTTTFLVGPYPYPVDPNPVPPPDEPEKTMTPNWTPLDEEEKPVDSNPVSYASDILYDENGTPIRKNVDGTVTVVRAVSRILPFRR